jgi:hypothetical protein
VTAVSVLPTLSPAEATVPPADGRVPPASWDVSVTTPPTVEPAASTTVPAVFVRDATGPSAGAAAPDAAGGGTPEPPEPEVADPRVDTAVSAVAVTVPAAAETTPVTGAALGDGGAESVL